MDKWVGAAGICVNDEGHILMVLQGKPEEEKVWSVPSGGKENGESLEECCIREVYEETGYEVKVVEKLFEKEGQHGPVEFKVTYFEIFLIGGSPKIQDPDGLIYDISWKTIEEINELRMSFQEDREMLIRYVRQKQSKTSS